MKHNNSTKNKTSPPNTRAKQKSERNADFVVVVVVFAVCVCLVSFITCVEWALLGASNINFGMEYKINLNIGVWFYSMPREKKKKKERSERGRRAFIVHFELIAFRNKYDNNNPNGRLNMWFLLDDFSITYKLNEQ